MAVAAELLRRPRETGARRGRQRQRHRPGEASPSGASGLPRHPHVQAHPGHAGRPAHRLGRAPDRRGGGRAEQRDPHSENPANAHVDGRVADPAALGFDARDKALAWLDAEFANLAAATHAAEDFATAGELPRAIIDFMEWRRLLNGWAALASVALDAARRLGDRGTEARELNNLARALSELRRFDESIRAQDDAMRIYRELADRRGEALTLNGLGDPLQGLRRYDDAVTGLENAVTIFRELGDRLGEATALNNLGSANRYLWRLDESIAAHHISVSQAAAEIYGSGQPPQRRPDPG